MRDWASTGIDVSRWSHGEHKTTCPRCSSSRKKKNYPCLNVNLDQGVWHCWHCSWSGSLKQGDYSAPRVVKTWRRPDFMEKAKPVDDRATAWLKSRGITEAVIKRNLIAAGVSYFPQTETEEPCVLFPYRRRGEVVNVKHRSYEKLFRMEGGCERILYGLDDVDDRLVWVEGEVDKLSLEVAGIRSCVSVPDGAPAPDSKSYETKFDFMDAPEIARPTVHIIAVDNDGPGLRLRDELVRRLGPDKCRIVDWPDGCKDANDVLRTLGVDILLACINEARELPILGAHDVADYMDDVQRLYRDGIPRGVSTGWPSVDEYYQVRAGDVSVITGAPNSGKSEWLDALTLNLAKMHGWRVGIYSPEQGSPAEHIVKMAEKVTGKPFNPGPSTRMTAGELDQAVTWLNERFTWIEPEEPTLFALLDIGRQLVLRRGVRGIVLDPWNEIEHARPDNKSETEYIGECLRTIRRFARQHQVHVWIVAHPQKLQRDRETGQYPIVGPYEISGSANWNNKPDCVLSIWRDRSPNAPSEAQIHVQKVRSKYVGRLGMTTLTWNRVNGRYADPSVAARATAYAGRGGE